MVSKTADSSKVTGQQHVANEEPALNINPPSGNNVVNVQLNYDINQALDPESWNGDFQAISLHRSMEHLVSDVKNIKESLTRIHKYILGKFIDGSKANNVKDLEGISKVVWEFILSLYKAHWDSLYMNDSKKSFRNMVKSKFSPQVPKLPINIKEKEMVKPTYVSALPPLIPAKSPKEVSKISKYFKKNTNQVQKKLYTQASSKNSSTNISKNFSTNITMEILKIEEVFPHLQNKKIDQVQKIISRSKNKLKP